MERSRGNANLGCSQLYDCSISDLGKSRPLCPEDCTTCQYRSGQIYKIGP